MSAKSLKSTGVVGANTLLSRVLGFVRDVVFARFFGAGFGMDVFVIAFQIPNYLRRLFGEGAFAQAFVPVLGEYHTRRDAESVKELANRVAGTLGGILILVTIAGMLAAPLLIRLFAPLFEPDKHDLAVSMLRITFPYLFFISLTAFAAGILNTYRRFAVPAFTPVLLNVALIASAVWWAPRFEQPVMALAWGVFAAGVIQLLFQLPFLKQIGMLPRPRWGWSDAGVKKILRLMGPALFGASVAQINLIIDRVIASGLGDGKISWLYYSDRLMEFPLGVFAIAIATVILPGLSRQHAAEDPAGFSRTLDWALRFALIIAVPAAVGLFVLAAPTIATLFQYGEFSVHDTTMSAWSLKAYALGLLGLSLVKILLPGYFARQDTRSPVRFGVIALVVNIVLNVVLVWSLLKVGFEATHTGLALATGIASVVNAWLLWRGLKRAGVYRAASGWWGLILRAVTANVLMAVVLLALGGPVDWWSEAEWQMRALRLAGCVGAGAAVYFSALWLLGVRTAVFREHTI